MMCAPGAHLGGHVFNEPLGCGHVGNVPHVRGRIGSATAVVVILVCPEKKAAQNLGRPKSQLEPETRLWPIRGYPIVQSPAYG